MPDLPVARHLLRAKDLADGRYFEPLSVSDMAAAAGLSRAEFSRQFKRTFGESPHQYLLTRRLERAASLLRTTDWSIADVCFAVGAQSASTIRPPGNRTELTRLSGIHPATTSASPKSWSLIRIVPDTVRGAHVFDPYEDAGISPLLRPFSARRLSRTLMAC